MRGFFRTLLGGQRKTSYAQSGEDIIVDYVLSWMKIEKPTYLDVGAHHPKWLSNTYLFYKRGCRGVCVEPDPDLYKKIKRSRNGDVCLNVGVGLQGNTKADLYVMSPRTLNTFSRDEVDRYSIYYDGCKVDKIISVDLLSMNDILSKHFSEVPNFLSIDVEGLDDSITKSIDFERFRPQVICIETVSYSMDKSLEKSSSIATHMEGNDYFVYADTFINTIFVDARAWRSLQLPKIDHTA